MRRLSSRSLQIAGFGVGGLFLVAGLIVGSAASLIVGACFVGATLLPRSHLKRWPLLSIGLVVFACSIMVAAPGSLTGRQTLQPSAPTEPVKQQANTATATLLLVPRTHTVAPSKTSTPTMTEKASSAPAQTPTATATKEPTATVTKRATKPSTTAPTKLPVVVVPTQTQQLLPTNTPRPSTVTFTPVPQQNCDPSYPTVCIPPPPPDLNCSDISYRKFTVLPPDPHGFDKDGDGIGCES